MPEGAGGELPFPNDLDSRHATSDLAGFSRLFPRFNAVFALRLVELSLRRGSASFMHAMASQPLEINLHTLKCPIEVFQFKKICFNDFLCFLCPYAVFRGSRARCLISNTITTQSLVTVFYPHHLRTYILRYLYGFFQIFLEIIEKQGPGKTSSDPCQRSFVSYHGLMSRSKVSNREIPSEYVKPMRRHSD